ncbi:MAG: 2-C-methyl-D-erythritol 4-phosphate cytidylyltransferase [Acutalibacteraceae bacterium]
MELTELKLEYAVCDSEKSGIPVIIVAAGLSSRMGGINKQTALLAGVPVLARTLMAFERSEAVSSIILIVRPEDVFSIQLMAEKYGIEKLTDIVCGGATRQESVLNGFARLDKDAKAVLIHDGARPLVEDTVIRAVADGLKVHSAVTCAVPVKDTVKIVDKDGRILSTPERDSLAAVQTPQGVRVSDYLAAVEKIGDVSKFTDDMSVMEAAGYEAHTVSGSYRNIKITTPEDLRLAEYLISGEIEE